MELHPLTHVIPGFFFSFLPLLLTSKVTLFNPQLPFFHFNGAKHFHRLEPY